MSLFGTVTMSAVATVTALASDYFGQRQVTVFPVVYWYKCPCCDEKVRDEIIIISADNVHDAAALSTARISLFTGKAWCAC